MATYYSILTTLGLIKFADAAAPGGVPVPIAQVAVGDGLGAHYTPNPEQIALVGEKWRGPVNRVYGDPLHADRIIAEGLIPASVGGWTIRELGLLDDTGGLLAVGIYPATAKPAPGSGSEKDIYVRMVLQVSNGGNLTQVINSDLVMATQAYVDTHAALTNPHSATSAATAERLVLRDGFGRAQVAAPAAAADIARKAEVDTKLSLSGGTMTGNLEGRLCTGGVGNTSGHLSSFEAIGDAANAAFIALHRVNTHAVNFGLDTDNKLKVGGWSLGANAYKILDERDFTSGAGWQRFPTGFIIQWGFVDLSAHTTTQVTFPVAMTIIFGFNTHVTLPNGGFVGYEEGNIGEVTPTHMNVYNRSTIGPYRAWWYVFGQA